MEGSTVSQLTFSIHMFDIRFEEDQVLEKAHMCKTVDIERLIRVPDHTERSLHPYASPDRVAVDL